MLTKNVYLLYPAGYSGNYVNWAISASDEDLRLTTVKNPINNTTTKQRGAAGTSHLHERVPTHQNIQEHLYWTICNRPTEFKIYVIFTQTDTMGWTISSICRIDPDPVFILIHDNSDKDVRVYGNLNCIQKWPTCNHTLQNVRNLEIDSQSLRTGIHHPPDNDLYDFFNCADDQLLRNNIAKKQYPYFVKLDPLDSLTKKNYSFETHRSKIWYQTRSQLQPHELLASTYLIRDEIPEESIYQLSCADVVSLDFVDILQKILEESGCSSKFDVDPVRQVHQEYISAQQNLNWFGSIRHWRETGELDDYLSGHAAVQGFLLQELLDKAGYRESFDYTNAEWQRWYNVIRDESWPDCNQESDFVKLPAQIRHEMETNFDYKFNSKRVHNTINLHKLKNWESMSIAQINDIFCQIQH